LRKPRPHPNLNSTIGRSLFNSEFYAQGFSWEAGLLAERLVDVISGEDCAAYTPRESEAENGK